MGADLITHILVGPQKITEKRKGEAKKYFAQLILRLKELTKDNNWDDRTFSGDMGLAQIYRKFIKGSSKEFEEFCGQLADLIEQRSTLPFEDDESGDQINKEVDQWVDWWNKPEGRDTDYREWGNKKIVVNGGTSHGDSPSDEFDEISNMIALGVFDVLGIS